MTGLRLEQQEDHSMRESFSLIQLFNREMFQKVFDCRGVAWRTKQQMETTRWASLPKKPFDRLFCLRIQRGRV